MKETGLITEWKSISELREIPRDISKIRWRGGANGKDNIFQ